MKLFDLSVNPHCSHQELSNGPSHALVWALEVPLRLEFYPSWHCHCHSNVILGEGRPAPPEAITIDERKISKLGPDHAGTHERSARLPRFVVVLPSFHVLLLVVAYFISCCHRLRSISGGSRLCSTATAVLQYSSATAGSRRTAASAATGLRPPRRCAARGRRR